MTFELEGEQVELPPGVGAKIYLLQRNWTKPSWRRHRFLLACEMHFLWLEEGKKRKAEPPEVPGTTTQEFDPYGRECWSKAEAWSRIARKVRDGE